MKLNKVVYEKLVLQAQEAKEIGLTKLGETVLSAIGAVSREDEVITYSHSELTEDIYHNLWKVALNIAQYYDVDSIDIQKIDESLELMAMKVRSEIENTMYSEISTKVKGKVALMIGPLEPKLPGESE